MSKHIDAMFRPADEVTLTDAEYLAAHGLEADASIEAVVEADVLASLEQIATSTVLAMRY